MTNVKTATASTTAKEKATTAKAGPAVCNNAALATMLQGHIDQALERFGLGEQFSAILTGSKDGISINVTVAGTSVFHATLATADINSDAELLIAAFKAKVAPWLPVLMGLVGQVRAAAEQAIVAATTAEDGSTATNAEVAEVAVGAVSTAAEKQLLLTGQKLPNQQQLDYLIANVDETMSFEEAIMQMPVATNSEFVEFTSENPQV